MEIIDFKHSNIVIAKDQPQYQPLPALKLDTSEGEVISCWSLSLWERVRVLFLGKVWVCLLSFNKPVNPQMLSTDRKDLYLHPDDKVKD